MSERREQYSRLRVRWKKGVKIKKKTTFFPPASLAKFQATAFFSPLLFPSYLPFALNILYIYIRAHIYTLLTLFFSSTVRPSVLKAQEWAKACRRGHVRLSFLYINVDIYVCNARETYLRDNMENGRENYGLRDGLKTQSTRLHFKIKFFIPRDIQKESFLFLHFTR